MGYVPFSNVKTSRYDYIKVKKNWTREVGEYELSADRIALVEKCLEKIELLDETMIKKLARLARWAADDEVVANWEFAVDAYNSGVRPRSGPSLAVLCREYGAARGEELFKEFARNKSEHNKAGGTHTSVLWWIKKGYTEEQAKQMIKDQNTKISERRWEIVAASGVSNSEHMRTINPISKSYHGYDGLDPDEVEDARRHLLDKCLMSREAYNERHKDTGKSFDDVVKKRKDSMLKNGTGAFVVNKGSASKASMLLFSPLCDWLINRGYKATDIYVGAEGFCGERWIRHPLDNTYLLYDFTLLPCNVMIEFHGVEWHPKSMTEWGSPTNVLGVCPTEKRTRDLFKKKVAEDNGFAVLEIWSDEDLEEALTRCKEFIRDNEILQD